MSKRHNAETDVTASNDSVSSASSPADYSAWSVQEVQEWVATLDGGDFAEYAPIFSRNEINGRVLAKLTDEMLEKCGMDALGAREAILLARDEL